MYRESRSSGLSGFATSGGSSVPPPLTQWERFLCLSVTFQVTRSGWILLQYQQLYWLLCMHVSTSTNKNLYKIQNCLLKIALRSQEADRTEKPSLTLHEVSYSNCTKLMDLGFWGMDPTEMTHQVSWWRCRTALYRVCPKGQQDILKYRTNSVVLLWKTPCILWKLF